jgi:hypothetical protein
VGHKEVGGVALGFAGFVFLVMAFKGTWGNTWAALTGHKPGTAVKGADLGGDFSPGGSLGGKGGDFPAGTGRPATGSPFQLPRGPQT